jgi:uncharacterized protein DUF4339
MWHYAVGNERRGPVDGPAMAELIASGAVGADTLVWKQGMTQWVALGMTELAARLPAPGTIPPPVAVPAAAVVRRPAPLYTPADLDTMFLWYWILCVAGVVTSAIFIGIPALIAAIVLGAILHHRFWANIQDGHARMTPGIAVGLLFVPLFNLYWVFPSIYGLARDMGDYIRRHRVPVAAPNETLALWVAILAVTVWIPFLDVLTIIPFVITSILLTKSFTEATKAILAHRTAQPVASPPAAALA